MAAELSPVEALVPAITLLGFGAAAALASRSLSLSPIVGYLVAGLLIGPGALGLIEPSSTTHLLAELGVVFLLFDIGMHVSMRELKESRSDLLGLAPAHLLLTAAASTGIFWMLGVSGPIAIAVGVSLGLSSTAVVARILSERGQNSCPLGRSATHVLIFQDIVAIFLMIFASSLAGSDGATGLAGLVSNTMLDGGAVPLAGVLGLAGVQAALAFVAALVIGKYLVNPVFSTLAATRNDEAFTAFVLLMVLAAACGTAIIGLSLTLGAFLAGLAISGTPYRHQVQTEMGPFRGLLLSFFFISVGLSIEMDALIRNLPVIIAGALAILGLKTALGYVAARLNKWTRPGATQLAFLMAQGSEFTLVILSLSAIVAGLPTTITTITVAAVALSLALAPTWADIGMKLSRKLAEQARAQGASPETTPQSKPVIVVGLSPAGRLAIDALRDHDIAYVATEHDPDRFLAAVADGYQVAFGNATNMKLVDAIGGNAARAVFLGAPAYEVSKSVNPMIKQRFPDLQRYASVDNRLDEERFAELGIKARAAMTDPAGIELVTDMLHGLNVDPIAIREWLTLQADRYQIGEAPEGDSFAKLAEETDPIDEAA